MDAGKTMREAVMRSDHIGTRSSLGALSWGLGFSHSRGLEGGGRSSAERFTSAVCLHLILSPVGVCVCVYRQFPKEGIEGCNALVLTHDHADAILGLDDLRDLQHKEVHTPHTTTQAALHTYSNLTASVRLPYEDHLRPVVCVSW